MKKLISILVAVAMLASVAVIAITSVSATTETVTRYTLPVTDLSQWYSRTNESYNDIAVTDENACLGAEVVDGSLVVKPNPGNTFNYPHVRVVNPGGLVSLQPDDVMNLDFSYAKGTSATSNVQTCDVILTFTSGDITINSQITDNLSGSKHIWPGDYTASKSIGEIIQAVAPDKYDAIFGTGGNPYLVGIKFVLTSSTTHTTDTNTLTINSMTFTREVPSSSSSSSEDTSSTPSTPAEPVMPEGATWNLASDVTTDIITAGLWRDFGNNERTTYDALETLTHFDVAVDGNTITYSNFDGTSAMFGWAGKTFFTVEEGDILNLDLRYDTPDNAAWSWKVEMYNPSHPDAADDGYVSLTKYIAESAGITLTETGFLTTTGQNVVAAVDLADAVGAGSSINYIRIYLAMASVDATTKFTFNNFYITKAATEPVDEILYSAPQNTLEGWLTYDESYEINNYLAPIGDGTALEYTGHMKGTVTDGAIDFTFTDTFYGARQLTNAYGSFVRTFTAAPGLCTVDNDSYMNLHFKLDADSSLYGVQLFVRVNSGDQDVTPVLIDTLGVTSTEMTGYESNTSSNTSYITLPAGEYTVSIKVADLLRDYSEQAALLATGAPFIYQQLFVRADDSATAESPATLTVYDVSISNYAVYENSYEAPVVPFDGYQAPKDTIDGWLTYDPGYDGNTSIAPMAGESATAHMLAEVVTDGVQFTFGDAFFTDDANRDTNGYGSFVRTFNSPDGLYTVDNDTYANVHLKLEADSDYYGLQWMVRVDSGDQDLTPVIAEALGLNTKVMVIGQNAYASLPAGEYTFSIKLSDLLANYPEQLASLADGANLIGQQIFVRTSADVTADNAATLTVYDVSFTDTPTYASNTYDALGETPATPATPTGEAIYTAPLTPSSWGTWMAVDPPYIDQATGISATQLEDGSMRIEILDDCSTNMPDFMISNGGGIVFIEPGDELYINATLEGPTGANYIRWWVELAFNAAIPNVRIPISQYIGDVGDRVLVSNAYNQLPQGEYKIVLDIEQFLRDYDEANDTEYYNAVFGSGGAYLTNIRFCLATNDQKTDTDNGYGFVLHEASIYREESTDPEPPVDTTILEVPVDTLDGWYASGTEGWGMSLEDSDYMDAEVTADGLEIWPTGNHPYGYPAVRYEDITGVTGIATFTENYYVNFKIKYEGTDTAAKDRWQMKLNFGSTANAGVSSAISEAVGVGLFEGQLPAGEYQVSIKLSDLLYGATRDDGSLYDYETLLAGVLGEEAYALIGIQLTVYGADTSDVLTVSQMSITTEAVYAENTYTAIGGDEPGGDPSSTPSTPSTPSTSSETPSTSEETPSTSSEETPSTSSEAPSTSTEAPSSSAGDASTTPSTSGTSSVAQVDTGDAVMPIIAVAGLAVVSGAAVIISKKRSK